MMPRGGRCALRISERLELYELMRGFSPKEQAEYVEGLEPRRQAVHGALCPDNPLFERGPPGGSLPEGSPPGLTMSKRVRAVRRRIRPGAHIQWAMGKRE